MPRIRRGFEEKQRVRHPDLVRELIEELRQSKDGGQPIIEETTLPRTGALRVNVIWDKWDQVPDEERVNAILKAYEEVEGSEFRDRIVLPMGLTVPEAIDYGLLPYRILPFLRKGDPVSADQCRDAMIAQGASVLADPERPQLRFATEEEAKACVERLGRQLPGSAEVWAITHEPALRAD